MNKNVLRRLCFGCLCVAVCSVGLPWGGERAFAVAIPTGFDYLHTPDGGAVVNPSDYGLGPDIDIPLRSRPLYGAFPDPVDTVIQRWTGLASPPANPLGTMEAEIIALSLESISPVELASGTFFDLFVDLNPELRSVGSINVTSHTPGTLGSGTFDSTFQVNARLTFTEVGNPTNSMVFTVVDTITSTGSPWTHNPPPDYPGSYGWVPGPTTHTGPHPQTVPGTGQPLSEDPIERGYDFFVTPPGAGTFVDLSAQGLGIVPLEGVPLPNISPGPVDTVVIRKSMGPLEGGIDKIPIELVALHLKSSAPVDLSPMGIPAFADLHITVDAQNPNIFDLPTPNLVPPSTGQMEIQNFPGGVGGQFRACFGDEPGCDAMPSGSGLGVPNGGVHSNAIFVLPGGDPSNPADVILDTQAPTIFLSSVGGFQHGGTNRAGNFDMTLVSHTGPHPAQPERISEFVFPPEDDGDFNHDGIVDQADYAALRKFDDGTPTDYNAFFKHFGEILISDSSGDADGTVPEPGLIAVVAVGMLCVRSRRQRR